MRSRLYGQGKLHLSTGQVLLSNNFSLHESCPRNILKIFWGGTKQYLASHAVSSGHWQRTKSNYYFSYRSRLQLLFPKLNYLNKNSNGLLFISSVTVLRTAALYRKSSIKPLNPLSLKHLPPPPSPPLVLQLNCIEIVLNNVIYKN